MNELKNGMKDCPHCGARPVIKILKNYDCDNKGFYEDYYQVICKQCNAPSSKRDEAINNWNNRK